MWKSLRPQPEHLLQHRQVPLQGQKSTSFAFAGLLGSWGAAAAAGMQEGLFKLRRGELLLHGEAKRMLDVELGAARGGRTNSSGGDGLSLSKCQAVSCSSSCNAMQQLWRQRLYACCLMPQHSAWQCT